MFKISAGLNAGLFLLILSLAACSSSSVSNPSTAGPPVPEQLALELHLSSSWNGASGIVELQANHAGTLHQLACRIGFDPLTALPLAVKRGELVDSRAIFFSTVKATAYVPVAFTYHLGEQLSGANGSIASIQFEQLNPDVTPRIWILSESEFLIARDASAKPLEITLGGGS